MGEPSPGRGLKAGRLTARGVGGLAVYRVRGEEVPGLMSRIFRPATAAGTGLGELRFGHLVHDGEVVDEAVVAVEWDGRQAEISTHGGTATQAAVERLLDRQGVELVPARNLRETPAGPGPAVLSEALDALPEATGVNAVAFLLSVLTGRLSREVAGLRLAVREGREPATLQAVRARIAALRARSAFGLAITRPPRLVLAGAPNTGKSTLANALVGSERFIVTDEPGTTRDHVREPVSILDYPFVVEDCAGLRGTQDAVEAQGVQRAMAAVEEADLVLLTLDGSRSLPVGGPIERLRDHPRVLPVITKADLQPVLHPEDVEACCSKSSQKVSALTGEGMDGLRARILFRSPFRGPCTVTSPCPFTARQERELRTAEEALPGDPPAASAALERFLQGA